MATTDINGLVVLQGTDSMSPLHPVINTVTASISAALTNLDTPPIMRVFSTPVAGATWTKPAHLLAIRVRAIGGGGAGGGAALGAANQASFGGGGSSGSYVEAWFAASDLPSSVPYTVGSGGLGNSASSGSDGGDTRFGSGGSFIIAPGGPGAAPIAPAATHGTGAPPAAAPPTGTATNYTGSPILLTGNRADQPIRVSNGTTAIVVPCGGADSPFSTGGRAVANSSVGGVGAMGSGGSGAVSLGTAGAFAGGAGGNGLLIIEEFYGAV